MKINRIAILASTLATMFMVSVAQAQLVRVDIVLVPDARTLEHHPEFIGSGYAVFDTSLIPASGNGRVYQTFDDSIAPVGHYVDLQMNISGLTGDGPSSIHYSLTDIDSAGERFDLGFSGGQVISMNEVMFQEGSLPYLLTNCCPNGTNVFFDGNPTLASFFHSFTDLVPLPPPVLDADNDGVVDDDDYCDDTVIPEAVVSSIRLAKNRWALMDDDLDFDTNAPRGQGPNRSYSTTDTAGCSCEQIAAAQGLGDGQTKFGCSKSVMDDWVLWVVSP